MRLVLVELRRLLSRRLVRLLGLLVAGGIALAGLLVYVRAGTATFGPGSLAGTLGGTTGPLVLLAWMVGASFVGAEWATGSMVTTMTWEPRRMRLFVAKAAALVAFAFVATLAVQALLSAALLPGFSRAGGPSPPGWATEAFGVALRGAGLAVILGAIGLSVASIARNTAASVGLGFGYLLVLELLLASLVPRLQPWLITWNAVPFVSGDTLQDIGRTPAEGGLVLAAYAAAALVAAGLRFRTADVT